MLRSFVLLLPGRQMETGRTYLHPLPMSRLPMCSLVLRYSKGPDRLHRHPHTRRAPLLRSAVPAATGEGRWMDAEGAGSLRGRERISWIASFGQGWGQAGESSLTWSAGRMSPIVSQTPVLYQPLTSETGWMQIWRDLLSLNYPGDGAVTKGAGILWAVRFYGVRRPASLLRSGYRSPSKGRKSSGTRGPRPGRCQ